MEATKLQLVQIVPREMVLAGVMEIANGLMNNVNQKVCVNPQCQLGPSFSVIFFFQVQDIPKSLLLNNSIIKSDYEISKYF